MKPVPDTKPDTIVSTTFHRFDGGVVIDIPCVIDVDNQTLFTNDIYTLLDFGDNGAIVEHPAVRFFDGYLEGYTLTIVVLDLKSGEILKRKHRINNEDLPCNWVIMDAGYLEPKDRRDDLLDFQF